MAASLQRSTRLGLGLGLGVGLAFTLGFGACFIEPAQPANFRFECSSASECAEGEVCAHGLCQTECGGAIEADCGQTGFCLNGFCSSTCWLADDQCPSPQVCTSLVPEGTEDPDEPVETGVCVVPCSADNPCPEGELCYEDLGLCVAICMTSDDCGDGEECLMGLCVPTG